MIIFQVPQIGEVRLRVRSVHTGALGGQGAFHLREQSQQKERDAARASSAVLSFWSTPWPRADPESACPTPEVGVRGQNEPMLRALEELWAG